MKGIWKHLVLKIISPDFTNIDTSDYVKLKNSILEKATSKEQLRYSYEMIYIEYEAYKSEYPDVKSFFTQIIMLVPTVFFSLIAAIIGVLATMTSVGLDTTEDVIVAIDVLSKVFSEITNYVSWVLLGTIVIVLFVFFYLNAKIKAKVKRYERHLSVYRVCIEEFESKTHVPKQNLKFRQIYRKPSKLRKKV